MALLFASLTTLLAAAPPAAEVGPALHEDVWLARGARAALLVSEIDALRGFDMVFLEVRALDGRRSRAIKRSPVLPLDEVRRYARRGQLELYRLALRRAVEGLARRYLQAGWSPVQDARPSAGVAIVGGHELAVELAADGVRLVNVPKGQGARVARAEFGAIELSHERTSAGGPGRVGGIETSADGRWLFVSVDSAPTPHAQVVWRRRAHALSVKKLLRRLRLRAKAPARGPAS